MNSALRFVAVAALALSLGPADVPSRDLSPVSLVSVAGAQYRLAYPGEDPGDWSPVGDETSVTAERGERVQVLGWWVTCVVRDPAGLVLEEDSGPVWVECVVP